MTEYDPEALFDETVAALDLPKHPAESSDVLALAEAITLDAAVDVLHLARQVLEAEGDPIRALHRLHQALLAASLYADDPNNADAIEVLGADPVTIYHPTVLESLLDLRIRNRYGADVTKLPGGGISMRKLAPPTDVSEALRGISAAMLEPFGWMSPKAEASGRAAQLDLEVDRLRQENPGWSTFDAMAEVARKRSIGGSLGGDRENDVKTRRANALRRHIELLRKKAGREAVNEARSIVGLAPLATQPVSSPNAKLESFALTEQGQEPITNITPVRRRSPRERRRENGKTPASGPPSPRPRRP